MFTAEFGRPPDGARELAGTIARYSRDAVTTVAGFDLTFSPPKSVSALWAVADPQVAARIEVAHQQAVTTALRYVEQHLLFAREGTRGVRQVDVEGMVAAAFTHRDTRAGDPDLHTHVAVANKVRTRVSGKWLSIDARVLYKGMVSVSETYNTALYKLLERQGFSFADRPQSPRDAGKRPVRELVGVPPELNERWSTRRSDIEARRQELVAGFQREHHRPPSTIESIKLAQQATLETRDAKHEPRSLADQRARVASPGRRRAGRRARPAADARTRHEPHPNSGGARGRGVGRPDSRPDRGHAGVSCRDLAAVSRAGRGPTDDPLHRRSRRPGPGRRRPPGAGQPRPMRPAVPATKPASASRRRCAGRTGPASTRSPDQTCTRPPTSSPPSVIWSSWRVGGTRPRCPPNMSPQPWRRAPTRDCR